MGKTTEKTVTVGELVNGWDNDDYPWYAALGFDEVAPGSHADWDEDEDHDQALLDAAADWEACLLASLEKSHEVRCWWAEGITPRYNSDGSYELVAVEG